MSHRLFLDSIFSNARVWAFLKQVDEAEAALWRSAGCPHCGAALHSATYPRKPHGLAPDPPIVATTTIIVFLLTGALRGFKEADMDDPPVEKLFRGAWRKCLIHPGTPSGRAKKVGLQLRRCNHAPPRLATGATPSGTIVHHPRCLLATVPAGSRAASIPRPSAPGSTRTRAAAGITVHRYREPSRQSHGPCGTFVVNAPVIGSGPLRR